MYGLDLVRRISGNILCEVESSDIQPLLWIDTIIVSFHCSGNFLLFEIKLISWRIRDSNVSPPA
jgi:hypothetical protein